MKAQQFSASHISKATMAIIAKSHQPCTFSTKIHIYTSHGILHVISQKIMLLRKSVGEILIMK